MKKKKSSNINLIRRIILLSTIGIILLAGIVLFICKDQFKVVAQSFFPYIEAYDSAQTTIGSDTKSNNMVSMTKANTDGSVASGKVVTISTPEEFQLFANRCESTSESPSAFLSYNYVLLTDIDFAGTGINNIKPIGYATPFTGTFNGNGYELKNISLLNLGGGNNPDYQFSTEASKPIQYFALFSKNAGTISNLGILNPEITVSYTPTGDGLAYVAPFVGLNTGTISHCYTKETRKREINSTGIHTIGGFYVSGFASINKNTITDVYTSRTILSTSISQNVIAQAEIVNECDTGCEPINAYFYDSTITSYSGTANNECTIIFNESFVSQNIVSVVHYGTYEQSSRALTIDVVSNDSETTRKSVGSWYNLSSYSEAAQTYFKDEDGDFIYGTPIARGIKEEANLTFTISNDREFSYMYELFALNKSFATDVATFKITADIDMGAIYAPKYYQSDIGCTIVGALGGVDNASITIFNAPIKDYYSKTIGINCFGVFPYLTGSVSHVNVILGEDGSAYNFTYSRNDSNKLAIGAISGYVDGGTIENCNVYINISFDNAIGKYYFGAIAGMVGSTTTSIGKVKESTVKGSINQTNNSVGTVTETVDYLDGMVIGGAVGYLDYTTGSVDEVRSQASITSRGVTGKSICIGGVIGAGYAYKLNKLQYDSATINLINSSVTYSSLYVSGIVGRLLGAKEQVDFLTNKCDISVYQASNINTYVSGIMNVDIMTSHSTGTNTPISKNPLLSQGAYYFYGAAFKNQCNITITNQSNNLVYTDVLNVKSSNGFSSKLSGLYNVKDNDDLSIDMAKIKEFAPILNNIGGTNNYQVELQTAYNFKNISLTTSANPNSNVTYAGVALGDYISYTNVHNLGNITATISNQFGTSGSTKNIIISGVFKEVSAGCKANNIYNAGNIDISYTANVYGNIYASGICYANRNGFTSTEINKYNPSKTEFEADATGSLNNVINNGYVKATSPNFKENGITYTSSTVKSPNGQSELGSVVWTALSQEAFVDGNVYLSGITSFNESVITNAFNIANVTAANFVMNKTNKREINAAGISVVNIGMYAYILNSANDGDIKAFNLSCGEITLTDAGLYTSCQPYLSETNAAGISCRNDKLENGNDYQGVANSANPHSSQVISFTINYGSVYSYNYRLNVTSTSMEPNAKSAGILAMGLCNVINVVNYGNIYGSESSSGVFGIVYYSKFTAEVNSNIFIANTLNYGNVYMLERGYNHVHGSTYDDYDYIKYNDLVDLTISSAIPYALTVVARNLEYISIIGSVFSILNLGNASNTSYIKIRYLISYSEEVAISGAITGYPLNADPDVSTFYSAHIKTNAKSGAYETDTYMGKYIQYAPLISKAFIGTFVTAIDAQDNVSTAEKTYYGVFSTNFAFMKAIDGDASVLDINTYRSDAFISDYFEFVGAIYANPNLLEIIGWSEITYRAAAEAFATDLDSVGYFVDYISDLQNTTPINSLISSALNVDTWISKCDNPTLVKIVDELIENEDASNDSTLVSMLGYIFSSSSSSYSLITNAVRTEVLEHIMENDNTFNYAELLDSIVTYSNGYSTLLADSTIDNDQAGLYIKGYIQSMTNSQAESILKTYCSYLSSASSNSYFGYKNTEQIRYDLLSSMFENINDNTFYTNLADLINVSSSLSSYTLSEQMQMYNGYSTLNETELANLYKNIILNNQSYSNLERLNTYIDAMANEIGYYSRLIANGYSKTSLSNIKTDVAYKNTTVSNDSSTIIDERVALWNQIKNTTVFQNYFNSRVPETIYDLATEYNNTYQSITEPHNNGTFRGDTDENRLYYLYTTEITPLVYFYGPYTGNGEVFSLSINDVENGRGANSPITNYPGLNVDNYANNTRYKEKYFSVFHSSDDSLWSSSANMLSRGGQNSTTVFSTALTPTRSTYNGNVRYTPPALTYYDYDNEQIGGANTKYTLTNDYYVSGSYSLGFEFYGFGYGDANDEQQFKYDKTAADPILGSSYKTNDWTGTACGANDLYMYVSSTGETFSLNNGAILKAFNTGGNQTITLSNGNTIKTNNYRFYVKDTTGAIHLVQTGSNNVYDPNATIQIGRMNNGVFTAIHTIKNYSNDNSRTRKIYSFITFVCGKKMYTSCVSPTYHSTGRTGIYRSSGGWYNYFTWKQDKNTRVFTSQYIDYSRADLLNLDGVLTEYDGEYKSTDERNIINRLFNKYFANDSTNFGYVIAAALLEKNMYSANGTVDVNYLRNFFTTNIYSSTMVSGSLPLTYLYQTYSSTTVSQYLRNRAPSLTDKNKFLAYCASHQGAYADLILKLIELDADRYVIGSSGNSALVGSLASYSNLDIIQSSSGSINGSSFTQGFIFDSITLNLGSTSQNAYLYLKPVGSSGNLNVKVGSDLVGKDYIITTSNNNYIVVPTNPATAITLTADRDVVLYRVDVEYLQQSTYTYNAKDINYLDATNDDVSIYIDSEETMIGYVQTAYPAYSNVTFVDVKINITGYNNSNENVVQRVKRRDAITGYYYTATGGVSANSAHQFNNIPKSITKDEVTQSNIDCYWDLYKISSNQEVVDYNQIITHCDYVITYSYHDTNTIFSAGSVITANTGQSNVLGKLIASNNTLDNSTNYSTKYGNFLDDALYSLVPIDYSSVASQTYTGVASRNIIELLALSATHDEDYDVYLDYCVPCLVKLFITSSNDAFGSFITTSVVNSPNKFSDFKIIFTDLINSIGYYPMADAINNQSSTLDIESKKTIASAYLATDYQYILDNNLSVANSELKNYINQAMSATYRYINDNGTYSNTKFKDFCLEIGYSLSTAGYGIYALASSYGIEDGRFIPDNLVLSSMNPYYEKSGTTYSLTSTASASWRKGTGDAAEATSDKTSVNYAFYKEMRQLEKSISTAIIELDLTDGTNVYMANSNQTTKKNIEGTITYYITTQELAYIDTTLTISTLAIANNATLYLVNGTSESEYNSTMNKTITVTKNGNTLTTNYKFKVEAEDDSVYTIYDIKFVILPVTDTFDLKYSTGNSDSHTYDYHGGTVELVFESTALPVSLDLTPYITISKSGSSYNYLANKTEFTRYFSYYTYGDYQITDANRNARIKFEVFQNLPYGTYTITVAIGSNSDYVTLEKTASVANSITSFKFDNDSVTLNGSKYTSSILFGRTFDQTDLEVPAGTTDAIKPQYLSEFKISDNATYQATASYSYVGGLVKYIVTYVITSESGDTNVYTHELTEINPYVSGDTFASEYKNGDTYTTEDASFLKYTTTNVNGTTHVLSAVATIDISFKRNEGTPEYRTSYQLGNFYITENNFTIEDISSSNNGSGSGVAAVGAPYAGIRATITKACDVGTYVFRYTYTSTSTWGENTLERKYIFPLIQITKQASIDSWIENISFLDDYLSEGTSATKIAYQNALIPNVNSLENRQQYKYDSNEIYYSTYTNSQITLNSSGDITYQNAVKVSNQNYYILGNVSDASLASYAPTMTVDEYSEIYQYLTEEKANGSYGIGQNTNDTGLLATTGTTTVYLYLPYYIDSDSSGSETVSDEYEIFLVKMVVSGGKKSLTEVYRASDGIYHDEDDIKVKNTPVYTFTNLTLADIHSDSNTFTVDGDTYHISEYAGQSGNSSLYMNYIGNPDEGHFWYVSYAVFSESYLKNGEDIAHVDFYHISIIDLTNNIYFTIKVNVPNGFRSDAIFMTINYVTYDNSDAKENAVSIYAIVDSQNSSIYIPQYELAMLPSGYYTFTLELAPGYVVSYTASRLNNIGGTTYGSDNKGAYFPPSSVVPIQIDLVFTVEVDSQAITTTNLWGMGTSSTETVKASYYGAAATITQKSTSAEVNTNLTNLVSSSIKGTYVFTLNGSTVTKVQSGENTYEYTFTPQDNRYVATTGTITVTGTNS